MLRNRVPSLILVLFAIDLALGAIYLVDYAAGRPWWKIHILFDLDGEGNIPAWYASTKWFCVAVLLATFALANVRRDDRASWPLLLLPLVFLAFSIDEIAQIHEWVTKRADALLPHGTREGTWFSRTGIWMFVVGVPFIAFFVVLVRTIRRYFARAPGAFAKICAGVAIMLSGALVLETVGNLVTTGSMFEMLEVLAEELLEMLGATVVLWGAYELLERYGLLPRFDPLEIA